MPYYRKDIPISNAKDPGALVDNSGTIDDPKRPFRLDRQEAERVASRKLRELDEYYDRKVKIAEHWREMPFELPKPNSLPFII